MLWVAKENAKTMAKPSVDDLTRCKRAARYLKATRGYESTLVSRPVDDTLLNIAVGSGWGASHGRRSTSAAVVYRGVMVSACSRTRG